MVVLINPFEVPQETSDEAFLAGWQSAAEHLRRQPGFIDAQLHRALSPDARFRFINVAHWASPEAFRAAVTSEGFRRLASDDAPSNPALFAVVRTIAAADEQVLETNERVPA